MSGLIWVGVLALALSIGGFVFSRMHIARLDRRYERESLHERAVEPAE